MTIIASGWVTKTADPITRRVRTVNVESGQ
jgi:hypothetical protein